VTIDLSVKATDKSVGRTVFGRLEHKPNFPVAQQIHRNTATQNFEKLQNKSGF
jgi:hypothetical protein